LIVKVSVHCMESTHISYIFHDTSTLLGFTSAAMAVIQPYHPVQCYPPSVVRLCTTYVSHPLCCGLLLPFCSLLGDDGISTYIKLSTRQNCSTVPSLGHVFSLLLVTQKLCLEKLGLEDVRLPLILGHDSWYFALLLLRRSADCGRPCWL
jgi:hypothetical protein